MYDDRFYRDWMARDGLEKFEIKVRESDLLILCDKKLDLLANDELGKVRTEIEEYIAQDGAFAAAIEPITMKPDAPTTVAEMALAAKFWNVGPMAAVAGAVAQRVAKALLTESETVIVENGGDVYIKSDTPGRFALYAGERSPFSNKIVFEVDARYGLGVCTSSGRVGPSLSFGKADAVVAIAQSAVFADAAATSIANRIQGPKDVASVVDEQRDRGALDGLIACCGDKIGLWGEIRLAPA